MRLFTAILLLSLFYFTVSCKKSADDVSPASIRTTDTTDTNTVTTPGYDTVYPKSYYPIYPGSFWKYKVNDTSEATVKSDSIYRLHSYLNDYGGSSHSDTVYVPFLNGEPVYGYDHLLYILPGWFYKRFPIVTETVGDFFKGSYQDTRGPQNIYDYITVIEKTKRNNDSIIITKRQYVTNAVETLYYTEYTKGIGITKYCAINGATLDTTYKKVLVDYFINR